MIKLSRLLELAAISLRFEIRRLIKRYDARNIKAIVVDIDGTLLENGLPIEALKHAYGSSEGLKINKMLERDYANGKLRLDEALIEGNRALMEKKFSKRDWNLLVEKSAKCSVRKDIIEILHTLQKRGIKVRLSTKGSFYAAELLSKKFGFDGAIGSEDYI